MTEHQQALLAGDFVLGLILGILFGLFLVVVFYVVPHLWWAWHNRRPSVEELVDLDSCDMCLDQLTDDNAAITCDAHKYCVACDDHANRCTACRYARALAVLEERP